MPADLPVAGAPGRVSPSVHDTWTTRTPLLWDIYYAVAFAGVVVLVLVVHEGALRWQRLALAGLLALMALWFVGLGRRVVAAPHAGWPGYVFQAGLLALYLSALALTTASAYLLFVLCPLAYMTVRMRAAHAIVVVYGLAPAVTKLVQSGDVAQTATLLLPLGIVAITMSVMMALTISRSERQSEERKVLIEQLASSRDEVARLSREAGVADERQRLASEIHDTIAQGLSSVVMLIEAALVAEPEPARRHLTLAARTARENLHEARAIVGALTPSQLTDSSLADALRRVVDRFAAETGIAATFSVTAPPAPLPPMAVDVVLLRVAQEAMTNVRKHAAATSVTVRLAGGPSTVELEVTDDGCGFDTAALHPGYGLGAMSRRVEQVGGRLRVDSSPGSGTTVRTEIQI